MTGRGFLVFDLDGTLSDPALGVYRCLNYALADAGLDVIPESAVSRYIGPPLDVSFRALAPAFDEAGIRSLVSRYRERYAEVGYRENRLYPGVAEALADLAARGIPLGVCTSKREDFAVRILEMFGLRDVFRFVDGGDVGIAKASQLGDLLAAGRIDADATMIGDRAVDILAARANGLAAVGVLWGHGSREELTEAGADLLLAGTDQLATVPLTRFPQSVSPGR
ncbi:MAG: hypothetical protein RLZZ385_1184 [Pseudomonadota bacterium]